METAAISPDGKLLATGGGAGDGSIRLWNAHTGQLVCTLRAPNANNEDVSTLECTPDSQLLAASYSGDNHIRLWKTATGQLARTWRTGGANDGISSLGLSFSPNGEVLASGQTAAAQRVQGYYIAPVRDAAPGDEIPWYATAYIAGPSLQAAVAEHGPCPAL